jgi:hypothetical protein
MTAKGRREFLKLAAGSALGAAAGSRAIAKALAIPANRATRSIRDVEHAAGSRPMRSGSVAGTTPAKPSVASRLASSGIGRS